MKSAVSIGIADAKGEETRFQGKKRLFHWELLFFQRGKAGPFCSERLWARREGQVASTTPSSASAKATPCTAVRPSPSTATPTTAALTGSSTVNTPACEAGTLRKPVIQSHTVQMLAASA